MHHVSKYRDALLLAARLMVAAVFLHAGYIKWPMWSVTPESLGMSDTMWNIMRLLAIVEPLGGVALIAGFLTRSAALGLSIILVGAIFVIQFSMGVGFSTATGPGWNFPLGLLAACIALIASGPGRWSIDALRHKE